MTLTSPVLNVLYVRGSVSSENFAVSGPILIGIWQTYLNRNHVKMVRKKESKEEIQEGLL